MDGAIMNEELSQTLAEEIKYGPFSSILQGERTALNFLQHLALDFSLDLGEIKATTRKSWERGI